MTCGSAHMRAYGSKSVSSRHIRKISLSVSSLIIFFLLHTRRKLRARINRRLATENLYGAVCRVQADAVAVAQNTRRVLDVGERGQAVFARHGRSMRERSAD